MEGKEKLSSRLTAAIFKDLRLEIKELRKYQLIFVTAEEVLSKKINKDRKLPYRFTPLHVIGTVISQRNKRQTSLSKPRTGINDWRNKYIPLHICKLDLSRKINLKKKSHNFSNLSGLATTKVLRSPLKAKHVFV